MRRQLMWHMRTLRAGGRHGTRVEAMSSAVHDEHRQQKEQLEALQRISRALHADLDLDSIVQRLTDEATALCRAEFGAFFYNVLTAAGESYTLYTLAGVPREKFSKFPMPRNTHVFAPTFRGEGIVRVDDITKDPRYGHNAPYYGMPKGHLPVRSYLALPVLSRSGEVLGGLFFGHSAPAIFTQRDEDTLVAIAAQAAIAIENARLYAAERAARKNAEEAGKRTERLQLITAQLSRTLTADEAARIVIAETRQLLGAESGAVMLLDTIGSRVTRLIVDGEVHPATADLTRNLELASDLPMCNAIRTGAVEWMTGGERLDERYPHLASLRRQLGAQTWGAVPIDFEGRKLGAIGYRCNVERPISADEQAFLIAIARQCGQAIERARLYDEAVAARADAEEANRAKDEFLAMLGHELRNPLSPILTAVQLMRMRGDTASASELKINFALLTRLSELAVECGPRFPQKSRHCILVVGGRFLQNLNGNTLIEIQMRSGDDYPHAATPDLPLDTILVSDDISTLQAIPVLFFRVPKLACPSECVLRSIASHRMSSKSAATKLLPACLPWQVLGLHQVIFFIDRGFKPRR